MFRTILRVAAVAVATVPVLLTTAVPASAGSSYFSRTTGVAATTEWVQEFDFPGDLYGNWHVGQLYAYETSPGRADVFAFIEDFQCEPGAMPQPDGHGGATPGCTYAGSRQLDGQGIAFTVARKNARATLEGFLTARTAGDPHSGEGGTTIGQVPANFTWTAVESAVRSTSTYRYRDSDGTYFSESFRSTSRRAEMSGRLGPMLFEEAASSSGSIESFTTSSRSRT
jgi:hypothetical protein